jgi:hypothetical protein
MENKMDFRLNLFLTFILAAVLTFCFQPAAKQSILPAADAAVPQTAIFYPTSSHTTVNCNQAGVAGCHQVVSSKAGAPQQLQMVVDLSQQMAYVP